MDEDNLKKHLSEIFSNVEEGCSDSVRTSTLIKKISDLLNPDNISTKELMALQMDLNGNHYDDKFVDRSEFIFKGANWFKKVFYSKHQQAENIREERNTLRSSTSKNTRDQNWNEEVFESHDDDDGKSGEKENVDALKGLNDDEAIHVIEANNVTEARRECKRLLEEKTTLEKRLQEVEEKNERVQEENKKLKVTLGVKEDEVKRLKADNETLGFESKHLEDRIAVNNRELRLHRGTEAELMDANSQLEAELRDFKDNLNATKELLDEQTKGNRDLKLNVEGKTAELNRLNELISRFELEQAEMDEINCNLEEQKMHLTEKLKLKEVEIDEFLEENSTLKEKLNFHLIIQDKQDVMNASFTEWNKLNRRRSSGMFDLIKNSTAINAADCPNLGDEMASVQHGVQTQDRGVMTAHDEILVLNNNNTDDINNNNDINNNDNVDREEKVVKKLGKLSFAVFLSFLTFCFFFGSLEFDDRIVKPAGFVWLSQWLEIPPVVIYAERTEFAPVW